MIRKIKIMQLALPSTGITVIHSYAFPKQIEPQLSPVRSVSHVRHTPHRYVAVQGHCVVSRRWAESNGCSDSIVS
jgi:hypothetical protein